MLHDEYINISFNNIEKCILNLPDYSMFIIKFDVKACY